MKIPNPMMGKDNVRAVYDSLVNRLETTAKKAVHLSAKVPLQGLFSFGSAVQFHLRRRIVFHNSCSKAPDRFERRSPIGRPYAGTVCNVALPHMILLHFVLA